MDGGAWKAAVHGVAEGPTWLSDITFTFHLHALEKEMATHSSVLAWRIPGTGEPGRLPSIGSHRVGHDWSDLAAAAASYKLEMPNQIIKMYFIISNTNFTNCINIFVLENICFWFRTLSVFMNFSYGIQNIVKSKPCHHFNFSHLSLSIIELFIVFITIYISL